MPADPVLLAVSGGVDSVVMAHLFHECGLRFGIAHVNFMLRGKESNEDEIFVKSLAEQLQVPCYFTAFNTEQHAAANKISVQMAARQLRYEWLEKVRKDNGFHRIATAHHLDDSIETSLINMFRGTGLRGLKGIPFRNEMIVRPLLCFFKDELKEHAHRDNIVFREDASNLEVDYDRNKIRLEVIPAIEKHFPSFRKSFEENLDRWEEAANIFEHALHRIKKQVMEMKGDEQWISIASLRQIPAPRTILFELLKEFGFNSDQSQQVFDALESSSGKLFSTATHRLLKDRKHLIIAPAVPDHFSEYLIHEGEKLVDAGGFTLTISEKKGLSFDVLKETRFSCLDKEKLQFPLLLRRWKKGDYFYPFGITKNLAPGKRGKKKISDYLIDRKIPVTEKDNIWVITSGKRIACIIGERIDDRFKVSSSTPVVYLIEKKQ